MRMTRGNSRLRKLASGKRSKLEERIGEALALIGSVEYEPDRLHFIQPAVARYYVPDFKLGDNNYIEVKGRLTLEDRKKLLWVKEQHPNVVVRLIFGNASNKLTKRSKTTYRDWAVTNGFDCIDSNEPIPKHWFNKLEKLSKRGKKLIESS